ncbi:nucleoid disruption protein [Pectobacterium phage POP12]|nr:nucleoid disruption protein [Pectobacterium phage POP12]
MNKPKRILTRSDLVQYATKIGDLSKGVFQKYEGVDLKEAGFYMVVDDSTGRAVFRFYVAPNARRKTGATRTLQRIRKKEHEPSAMVALLNKASLYIVPHDKIKNLFGLPNLNNSQFESAIQLRYDDGENYTTWNRALNDMYDFEFQIY